MNDARPDSSDLLKMADEEFDKPSRQRLGLDRRSFVAGFVAGFLTPGSAFATPPAPKKAQ